MTELPDAGRLRADFDEAFARPPLSEDLALARFLLLRVAGGAKAVPLAEIAGVRRDVRVVPVPGAPPALLGLAGERGRLVPVFDLSALLGGAPAGRAARWVVLAAGDEPAAFAFESMEGFVEVRRDQLSGARHAGTHVVGLLRTAAGVQEVVSLASVVASLVSGTEGR